MIPLALPSHASIICRSQFLRSNQWTVEGPCLRSTGARRPPGPDHRSDPASGSVHPGSVTVTPSGVEPGLEPTVVTSDLESARDSLVLIVTQSKALLHSLWPWSALRVTNRLLPPVPQCYTVPVFPQLSYIPVYELSLQKLSFSQWVYSVW